MATISAGNGGTDPWKLLSQYVQNQQRSTAMNVRGEELALNRQFTRERLDRAPTDAYNRQRALGQANIENAQAALAAGLDPGAGSGRGGGGSRRGSGVINSKAATEFANGLRNGGITNPIALATLMGNSQIESAGFDPTAVGDNGTAYGHMQWRLDRQQRLRAYARSIGRHESDPFAQGKFAAWELTEGTERAAGQKLLNANNLEEAQLATNAYLRMKNWDKGAGAMHYSHRLAASRDWASKITGDKSFNPRKPAAGPADVLTDPADGRTYTYEYPRQSYIRGLMMMGPGYEDIAKRYVPDPDGPRNKNGEIPFRYYTGTGVKPSNEGTGTTTTAAAPADPVTTGTVQPKLKPVQEVETPVEDIEDPDEDTEDDEF